MVPAERNILTVFLDYCTGPDEMLKLRWNSQNGAVYVDGQHFKVNYDVSFVVHL